MAQLDDSASREFLNLSSGYKIRVTKPVIPSLVIEHFMNQMYGSAVDKHEEN